MEETEPVIQKVNLDKLRNSDYKFFNVMIEAGLIDEQGIRISGLGIVIRKLENVAKMQDKTNLNLFHMEKKLH
jgi:hypothetical protein